MAAKKILLVEGKDDEHVLKHICGTRGIPRLDDVKEHGGAIFRLRGSWNRFIFCGN